jgi:dsDNA-specific endonuclease/ATPase MutS2
LGLVETQDPIATEGGQEQFLALFFMTKRDQEKEIDASAFEVESPFGDPVEIPLQDSLDLHPFLPKDIPSVVEEYLEQCKQAGFREVRLIHGKGKGVQRTVVHSLLGKHPAVASFYEAPLEGGGWGATMVVLKRKS